MFCRQPTEEDIVNIVSRMYEKDGITKDEVVTIVQEFPNQGANPFVSHVLVFIWFISKFTFMEDPVFSSEVNLIGYKDLAWV